MPGVAADRGEVETTVLFAGVPYRGRTVALGQHHHGAASRLKLCNERIHAPGSGRAESSRGVTLRGLGRSGIIDGMVLEIGRQALPPSQALAQLGVRKVTRHDHGTAERKSGLDRV